MKMLLGIACAALLANGLNAQVIQRTFDITMGDPTGEFPDTSVTPPVANPFLSLTISWDPSLSYTNETAGVFARTVQIPESGQIGFTYAAYSDYITIGGVGGALGDANSISSGTDDFFLAFGNASSTPDGAFAAYSTAALPNRYFFPTVVHINAMNGLGVYGAAPEPASWALMILGFGAVGASMRRRKVSVSYA